MIDNTTIENPNLKDVYERKISFDEVDVDSDILWTGIKVIDFFAPIQKGSKLGLLGGAGVVGVAGGIVAHPQIAPLGDHVPCRGHAEGAGDLGPGLAQGAGAVIAQPGGLGAAAAEGLPGDAPDHRGAGGFGSTGTK